MDRSAGKPLDECYQEDAIETLARYNEKRDAARTYGEECYDWMQSFAEYERKGASHAKD